MASTNKIVWSVKELTAILRQRQLNKFDCNLGVSGKRGDGKSTLLFKFFNSFKNEGFDQKKQQVYSQKDVIDLLAKQTFGFCWDDEAINSGYKRNFQQAGQKALVQIITNYRDNYNIYASALPFFYSLDKDLRELIFMHIHIIERGLAVILLPLSDQIHSQDPWDTMNNIKIEQKEYQRMKRDPNATFRYYKLSTFAGYLYFGDMTSKQREFYEEIKKEKRNRNFEKAGILNNAESVPWKVKVYNLLLEGKLTKNGLIQSCLLEGEKYTNVISSLNQMLKDKGVIDKTVGDFLIRDDKQAFHNKNRGEITDLVPDITS